MPCKMLLDSLSGTNFHYTISALSRLLENVVRLTVIGVQTVKICHLNDSTVVVPKIYILNASTREQSNKKYLKEKTRQDYV